MKWRNPFSIFTQLDRIERKVDHVSSQEQELDSALTDLGTKIQALVDAVAALIAKLPDNVDLTDEIAAVTKAAGDVQGLTDEAAAATAPPAP